MAYWCLVWCSTGVDGCLAVQGIAWCDFVLSYTSFLCNCIVQYCRIWCGSTITNVKAIMLKAHLALSWTEARSKCLRESCKNKASTQRNFEGLSKPPAICGSGNLWANGVLYLMWFSFTLQSVYANFLGIYQHLTTLIMYSLLLKGKFCPCHPIFCICSGACLIGISVFQALLSVVPYLLLWTKGKMTGEGEEREDEDNSWLKEWNWLRLAAEGGQNGFVVISSSTLQPWQMMAMLLKTL